MDRLGEITVPTLVMAGRDDFVFPPEHQAELAAGIPNARLRIIERAGHNPHRSGPPRSWQAVRDFISAGTRRCRLPAVTPWPRRGEDRAQRSASSATTRPTRSRRRTATSSSARRSPPSRRSCPTAIRRPRSCGATSTASACASTRCVASPRSGTCAATRGSRCSATTRASRCATSRSAARSSR